MKKIIIILFCIFIPINVYAIDCWDIDGLSIFGYDGSEYEFIGSITNPFGSTSIANEFGYGSEFKSISIFNEFGRYGSEFRSTSAFNDFAFSPPILVNKDLNAVGYVTTNEFKQNAVHPNIAKYCADKSFGSALRGHEDLTFDNINSYNYSSSIDYDKLLAELLEKYETNCPINSTLDADSECYCNDGYIKNGTTCLTYSASCQQEYGSNTYGDKDYCYCKVGYEWDTDKTKCITPPIVKSNLIKNMEKFVAEEANKLSAIDKDLTNKLKGKILLQVENKGQAWYVNPKDGKRYYMADGSEAYEIMRKLGVGITNADLEEVKADTNFAKKHSGKIFLQIEDLGQAFYIDFDGNARYLKDGNEAYNIMRDLGLGITNNDLNKIDIKI